MLDPESDMLCVLSFEPLQALLQPGALLAPVLERRSAAVLQQPYVYAVVGHTDAERVVDQRKRLDISLVSVSGSRGLTVDIVF